MHRVTYKIGKVKRGRKEEGKDKINKEGGCTLTKKE